VRYPVTSDGSLESFNRDWYNAQGFGAQTSYGYHEGADLNLKTGGDSDLGQELKAIANGRIVYYHYASHPTTGFGRHLVYKIDGGWGTRWVMYSHCDSNNFLGAVQDVSEGQIIARLGKSGNSPSAHLHWSIFKVDPATFGIDNFANNLTELNQHWEDPIAFVNTWMVAPPPTPTPDIRLQLLNEAGITDEALTREAIERYQKWDQLQQDLHNQQISYSTLKVRLKTAINSAIDATS
jgi:hypothetical protein